MFTHEDLKTLVAVLRGEPHTESEKEILLVKVEAAVDAAAGGPCRGAPPTVDAPPAEGAPQVTIAPEAVMDMAWLSDAKDLEHSLSLAAQSSLKSQQDKLAIARRARRAAEDHIAKLEARVEALKDVERIKNENERLRAEIDLVGPSEAEDRIKRLQHQLANSNAETARLQSQIKQLKTTLRDERLDRQVLEATTEALMRTPQLPAAAPDPKALPPANTCFDCGAPIGISDHRCEACIAKRPRT